MRENNASPSGEKMMSRLIELYADQMGVSVEYMIEGGENHVLTNGRPDCGLRQMGC